MPSHNQSGPNEASEFSAISTPVEDYERDRVCAWLSVRAHEGVFACERMRLRARGIAQRQATRR